MTVGVTYSPSPLDSAMISVPLSLDRMMTVACGYNGVRGVAHFASKHAARDLGPGSARNKHARYKELSGNRQPTDHCVLPVAPGEYHRTALMVLGHSTYRPTICRALVSRKKDAAIKRQVKKVDAYYT